MEKEPYSSDRKRNVYLYLQMDFEMKGKAAHIMCEIRYKKKVHLKMICSVIIYLTDEGARREGWWKTS